MVTTHNILSVPPVTQMQVMILPVTVTPPDTATVTVTVTVTATVTATTTVTTTDTATDTATCIVTVYCNFY